MINRLAFGSAVCVILEVLCDTILFGCSFRFWVFLVDFVVAALNRDLLSLLPDLLVL